MDYIVSWSTIWYHQLTTQKGKRFPISRSHCDRWMLDCRCFPVFSSDGLYFHTSCLHEIVLKSNVTTELLYLPCCARCTPPLQGHSRSESSRSQRSIAFSECREFKISPRELNICIAMRCQATKKELLVRTTFSAPSISFSVGQYISSTFFHSHLRPWCVIKPSIWFWS